MINIGDLEIAGVYIGDTQLSVYAGDVQIWPTSLPYEQQYLTFEVLSGGTITWKKNNSISPDKTIEYSKDNGSSWSSITSTAEGVEISVNAGDKVLVKGYNDSYTYVEGGNSNNSNGFSGTALFDVKGNIMSLIYGSFTGSTAITADYTFTGLFRGSKVRNASNLVLPATTLTFNCYRNMFQDCTDLTTAPSVLPATTLARECYRYMFGGCSSLTTAPSVLPATTLAYQCYYLMFYRCNLLTQAPELPATTLAEGCYYGMFRYCTGLNYIKCLATDISATNCTQYWVQNVASTGDFVKAAGMNDWTTGNNGIPYNWTVQDDCNPVVLYDNLGNTNNQGYSKSGFYTFDSTVTAITPCTYDFSGITCICARDDGFYSIPNAFLGRSNGGMSTSSDGCLRSVETIEIDCTTVTTLAYPFGNDSQNQFCQSVTSITLTNTDRITTIRQLVRYCTNLVNLSIGSFANVSTVGDAQFTSCPSLTNLTIAALPKRDITGWGFNNLTNLTEQSVINILNALPSNASNTITIGTININKLTSAEGQTALANARNKGWTVN